MQCYDSYEQLLGEEFGLAQRAGSHESPGQPVYTVVLESRSTQPAAFLSLRADPHAQYEIRVHADAIVDLVKDWVPHTYDDL